MKYFFRYLKNNPFYALINIVGLSIALMFVILLGDYTYRQFNIDRWHHNADRIQVLSVTGGSLASWPESTHALQSLFPEIESTCCVNMHIAKIKYEDKFAGSSAGEGDGNVMLADSTFFDFFDFKFISGDRKTALDSPEKCVITESLAKKLFPDKNPLGQPLSIVGSRYITISDDSAGDPYDSTLVYTVSGVMQNLDRTVFLNSTELIANSERAPQVLGYRNTGKTYVSGPLGGTFLFLMTASGAELDDKTAQMSEFFKNQVPALALYEEAPKTKLIPLDALMFAPQNDGDGIQKGDRSLLKILLAVVLAILLFSVTNYINLTTANTGFRAKEVAVRRLLGSNARGISLELVAESTIMVIVSFFIGFALALFFEDTFTEMFQGKIDLISDISFGTVSVCILFILFAGILSGVIPTMMLLKFKPIDVVKGTFRHRSKMLFSKIFIVLQNIITVTMITSVITIYLQINHLIQAPLGYDVKNLYYISADESDLMRHELEAQPYIKAIGAYNGSALDGNISRISGRKYKDAKTMYVYVFSCDSTYLKISGLKVLRDNHLSGDVKYISQALSDRLGLEDDCLEIEWSDRPNTMIAGVLGNFHSANILDSYKNVEMTLRPTEEIRDANYLVLTDGSRDAYMKLCELVKKVDNSSEELDWKVRDIEKNIAESFSDERNTMNLIVLFTCIALLISVLGFIGMSLFFIRQRRKEIGVRRILGGTVREILTLLIKKFCAPLLVSFVFAVPISYFLMNRYLENFSYRIGLSPLIFLAAVALSLLVAVLSVLLQALRASRANPADSIRTE